MNPKQRERPVLLSMIRLTLSSSPNLWNSSRKSSSLVVEESPNKPRTLDGVVFGGDLLLLLLRLLLGLLLRDLLPPERLLLLLRERLLLLLRLRDLLLFSLGGDGLASLVAFSSVLTSVDCESFLLSDIFNVKSSGKERFDAKLHSS